MEADAWKREAMLKEIASPLSNLQPRKRKLITNGAEDADEVESHPPEKIAKLASPPRCKIIRMPTPPKNPPATEAIPPQAPSQAPPQAPPQAPTPPRAPTPPVVEPSLNDNFEPERSPPARNEPSASKDYSSGKSDDESDDSDEEESDSNASEEPEANATAEAKANDDNDLAIINPSQERAIVVTRETGLPHISPPPRRLASKFTPVQDTQLDSLYPCETFPI